MNKLLDVDFIIQKDNKTVEEFDDFCKRRNIKAKLVR